MISFILTIKRLLEALYKAVKEPIFLSLITTLFFIVLSGTLFYKGVEGWHWLDALYFSFVSLIPTGVETGLVPDETMSKVFTMIYLVVGFGVMLGLLLIIGKAVLDFEMKEVVKNRKLQNK